MRCMYQNATFVLVSTGGWEQREWSPCKNPPHFSVMTTLCFNSIESSFNETTLKVAAGGDSNNDDDAKRKVFHSLYRVTIHVVPSLSLTSKQKFRFSMRTMY